MKLLSYLSLSIRRAVLLFVALVFIIVSFFIDGEHSQQAPAEPIQLSIESTKADRQVNLTEPKPQLLKAGLLEYTVQEGDSLDKIRKKLVIEDGVYGELLEADRDSALLALDNLKKGNKLQFSFDQADDLTQLTLELNPARKVHYKRGAKGFDAKREDLPGVWKPIYLEGVIVKSFSEDMISSGAKSKETYAIHQLLKNRINFSKDLQKGNRFRVLISRQFVDDKPTGQSRLQVLELTQSKRKIEAFSFKGGYYDQHGKSIEKSFDLKPFKGDYRISSHFSHARKHPVTGAIKPHLGTDYALPTGTPVYATADGVVSRVVFHQYAGLYVELNHGNYYKTRYLHLSKAFVKPGQPISRGALIAKSGATGRITGPHLHYEFHEGGKAVNSLKASALRGLSIKDKDKPAFLKQVAALRDQLNASEQRVAKHLGA